MMRQLLVLALAVGSLAQFCDPSIYGLNQAAFYSTECANNDQYVEAVFGQGTTCAALNCDGSGIFDSSFGFDPDWANVFAALCPVKCGTCADYCLDKPAFLTSWSTVLGATGQTPSPTSCTSDTWPTVLPFSGYCDIVYRQGCAATATPPFCAGAGGASASKDPHLHLAHGGRADFRGAHNKIFNFLSARNVSFNVKMEAADFHWRVPGRTVHGTRMAAVSWVLRADDGTMFTVGYEAPHNSTDAPGIATVRNKGKVGWESKTDTPVTHGRPFAYHGISVTLDGSAVIVVAGGWSMKAQVSPFPFSKINPRQALLDVEATPLYDVEHGAVAPHGLVGQSFDGDNIAVDGKIDSHGSSATGESTTTAQAEGAIEGLWSDYEMSGPFATAFKYSRFDAISAAPRDVAKLEGHKHKRTGAKPLAKAAGGVSVEEGTDGSAVNERRQLGFKGKMIMDPSVAKNMKEKIRQFLTKHA